MNEKALSASHIWYTQFPLWVQIPLVSFLSIWRTLTFLDLFILISWIFSCYSLYFRSVLLLDIELQVFFRLALKRHHVVTGLHVSHDMTVVRLYYCSPYVSSVFPSSCLEGFSLDHWFSAFCLSWALEWFALCLFCLGFWASWICELIFPIKFEKKNWALFHQIQFSVPGLQSWCSSHSWCYPGTKACLVPLFSLSFSLGTSCCPVFKFTEPFFCII